MKHAVSVHVRSSWIRRAGLSSLAALVLLGVALSLAYIDLSGSNKPHELRFETVFFVLVTIVALMGAWTVFSLVAALRSPASARLGSQERFFLASSFVFLAVPLVAPVLMFFSL